jgi:hypothetical protein
MCGKPTCNSILPGDVADNGIVAGIINGFSVFYVTCCPICKNKSILAIIGSFGYIKNVFRLSAVNKVFSAMGILCYSMTLGYFNKQTGRYPQSEFLSL